MKSLSVVQLIKSLKPSEKKHIEFDFQHYRQGAMLEKLFKLIAHTKAVKLKKPFIFEQPYNEPYEKSKDYLIRNIFRNLTRKIEAFLVDQAFHREIHKNLNTHNYFLSLLAT